MISWLRRKKEAHPVADEELSAYVDGELPPARGVEVEAHAAGCERCRAALAELRALKSMLAAVPSEAPRRSFALSRAVARSAAAARPRALAFAPAVAASVLVLLLAVDVVSRGGAGDRADFAAATSAEKSADTASLAVPPSAPAPLAREAASTPGAVSAGAAVAQGVAGTPQPGDSAANAATAPAQAEAPAARAAADAGPSGAPPAAGVADDGGGGPSALRMLQVAAALALLLSLAYLVQSGRRQGI